LGKEPRGQKTGEEVVEGQRGTVACKQGGDLVKGWGRKVVGRARGMGEGGARGCLAAAIGKCNGGPGKVEGCAGGSKWSLKTPRAVLQEGGK